MWDQVLAALSFELAKLSLSIEPKSKPPRPFIQLKRVETTGGTVPGGHIVTLDMKVMKGGPTFHH